VAACNRTQKEQLALCFLAEREHTQKRIIREAVNNESFFSDAEIEDFWRIASAEFVELIVSDPSPRMLPKPRLRDHSLADLALRRITRRVVSDAIRKQKSTLRLLSLRESPASKRHRRQIGRIRLSPDQCVSNYPTSDPLIRALLMKDQSGLSVVEIAHAYDVTVEEAYVCLGTFQNQQMFSADVAGMRVR
jgi:hypothetical protein